MTSALVVLLIALVVLGTAVWWSRQKVLAHQREQLEDDKAEARRWVERLGGQVLNLVGTNEAAKQALADASERHAAALTQLEQATTSTQARLTTQSAMEGLYYVRAARMAMDVDPGPELPSLTGQRYAGHVSEEREVEVDGTTQVASPNPSERTPHYYPGGTVAGRPVPEGWYSDPWWKPAMATGMWTAGSYALMSAMFIGMATVPTEAAYADGFADGAAVGDVPGPGGDPGLIDDSEAFNDGGMGGFDFGGFGF
ncbi:hypothetical protein EIL87_04485 [Saccharopolyspora rhizosphaerae]|uniref:DUF1542 domain-containing protein n=1 Tax=Saccharopolyspora rhizosphaerae TaxID=2492662 RepID=A0A3R8P933_9PSEU|nr:hypothetical protein [Saccharopolyspora rhizosphaerae]RRO19364.1 hypothetical protein EIL87_04485 [Saccharopolyspora rhizosphaerae]